jgi:hypothetical protein
LFSSKEDGAALNAVVVHTAAACGFSVLLKTAQGWNLQIPLSRMGGGPAGV